MRVFAYLLFVVFILTASDSEAAVINNLRAGNYADKTRIVLDLDEVPEYSEMLSGSQLNINIDADVRQENVLKPKSDLVKKVISCQRRSPSKYCRFRPERLFQHQKADWRWRELPPARLRSAAKHRFLPGTKNCHSCPSSSSATARVI